MQTPLIQVSDDIRSNEKDRRRTTSIILLIVFITILMRGILIYPSNFTVDDAFITFRYAENIASGKGFVYNQGERVLGTSTPLFTLLLAFFAQIGLPTIWVARIINVAADCLTGILLFLLFRPYRFGLATLAALLYVLFPRVIVWSVSGMETSLYVFFIAAGLYTYHNEKFNLTGLFLALAFLTRADGIIFGLAILIDFVLRYRKFPTSMVLTSFALVLPWLIFSFAYFGSPIPNSVPGKKALYAGSMWETPKWKIFWEFLFLKTKVGFPLLLLALAGVYRILIKAKSYSIIALWCILYFVFFFFAETRIHMWYYVPFYLGYMSLVAFSLYYLFERGKDIWRRWLEFARNKKGDFQGIKALGFGILFLMTICAGFIYFQQIVRTYSFVAAEQVALESIHKQMGFWLLENTQPGDTVCAEDIGYLGYYSGRYILDQDGLISPQAIPFNKEMNRLDLLKKYKPKYFLIRFSGPYYSQVIESEWLKDHYEMMTIFGYNTPKPERGKLRLEDYFGDLCKYNVYKRKNLPTSTCPSPQQKEVTAGITI
jgi:Gpi18-like mannosyltransferase